MEEQKEVEEKISVGNLYDYISSNIDQFWKSEGEGHRFPSFTQQKQVVEYGYRSLRLGTVRNF